MKRMAGLKAAIFLAAALGLGGCETKKPPEQPTVEEVVDWKVASSYSTELPLMGTGAVRLAETLAEVSGGRIKLNLSEPDALVPSAAVFDAVGDGTIDAAWSSAGLWVDRFPAAAFFSAIPFGPDATEYLAWIYHGGGLEFWKEIYGRANVVPIPCGVLPPEASGWFRQPITNVDQFKGMKIRFKGMGGLAMQKLGASVHLLAVADIYPALEKGVLDATKFSFPTIDEKLGFDKVTKHYYFPGWQQQASLLELIVNRGKWEGLSPRQRALLEMACRANVAEMLTEGEHSQGAALENFKQKGVRIHYWSDELLNAFKKAHDQVLRELSARDPDFERVLQSYLRFRENFAPWANISRLPPNFQ